MQAFDLPPASRLKVVKVTPRKETHGKELVQAISMRLEWWPDDGSAALNKLHPNLQDAIYWTPPDVAAQCAIEGIPAVKKHRRVPTMATPLKIEAAFTGYQLTIEHGIDDSTALELYACALDKFEAEPKEGGAVAIRWSLASNKQVTPQLVGLLCGLEGSTVVADLVPPLVEDAIDGSPDGGGPGFQGPEPDAGDLFAAAHQDEGGPPDSGTDGEGSDTDVDPSIMGGNRTFAAAVKAELAGLEGARTELPRTVKYRSPITGETWSGRGQQPAWVKKALAAGKTLSDLLADPVGA